MLWLNILRGIILVAGIVVIAFDAELYVSCKEQKTELNSMKDRLDVESEFNGNKFKYQQQQIEAIRSDLDDAQQQIENQHDESKGIQTSLVDIKAEADAIKENAKEWQKDYVSVLAQIEKKLDNSEVEMKSIQESINSLKTDIEKMTPVEQAKDKSEIQP
jgi:chromosome segregation ATPase